MLIYGIRVGLATGYICVVIVRERNPEVAGWHSVEHSTSSESQLLQIGAVLFNCRNDSNIRTMSMDDF